MMRAKLQVQSVEKPYEGAEQLKFSAMYSNTPEDNSYSKYTPCATLDMTVTNPDLLGKFKNGDNFYLDFTKINN